MTSLIRKKTISLARRARHTPGHGVCLRRENEDMVEVSMLTPSEFERGYKAFQAREARDAMYKTAAFLVEHFWGKPRDMADGMGVLLLTWNQAFYRGQSFDFGRLEKVMEREMSDIKALRPRDIQSFSKADEPVVRRLFLAVLKALRITDGKRKDIQSPVAAAKALHLLAPNFLPLWDEKIARAYACYYKPYPDQKYMDFIQKTRTFAQRLQGCVPPRCEKTVLKLIDEYNYAKYTKHWI